MPAKQKKRIFILLFFIIPVILVFTANYAITKNAGNKTFYDASKVKKNKVGLVLGTSKYLKNLSQLIGGTFPHLFLTDFEERLNPGIFVRCANGLKI